MRAVSTRGPHLARHARPRRRDAKPRHWHDASLAIARVGADAVRTVPSGRSASTIAPWCHVKRLRRYIGDTKLRRTPRVNDGAPAKKPVGMVVAKCFG